MDAAGLGPDRHVPHPRSPGTTPLSQRAHGLLNGVPWKYQQHARKTPSVFSTRGMFPSSRLSSHPWGSSPDSSVLGCSPFLNIMFVFQLIDFYFFRAVLVQSRIKTYPSCNDIYPAATLRGTHGNVPCTPETTDMHSLPNNRTCPHMGRFLQVVNMHGHIMSTHVHTSR